jgi:hypothetical protein
MLLNIPKFDGMIKIRVKTTPYYFIVKNKSRQGLISLPAFFVLSGCEGPASRASVRQVVPSLITGIDIADAVYSLS